MEEEYCTCNGVKFFASGCESGLQCAKCLLVTKPMEKKNGK